jgi:hypothetical protein
MEEMKIVALPQLDKISPWLTLVPLRRDPDLLLVVGNVQLGTQLCSNKSLVIVCGGIDKMAEDLFL